MPSLSYHLVMAIIRWKGIKKTFSQSPVDVSRLRASDLHVAPPALRHRFVVTEKQIAETRITEVAPRDRERLSCHVLYIHGGAFVSGPSIRHWNGVSAMVARAGVSAWMVDYPKAPETDIHRMTQNIDAVYEEACRLFEPAHLILAGDSAGANLMFTLVQRLIAEGKPLPGKIIAITPVFDASMGNPDIEKTDPIDPMLSKPGVLSANESCAKGLDLKDPLISPLYGSFRGFPRTLLFIGSRDILYPDAQKAVEKMRAEHVPLDVVDAPDMPHIWPLLPVMKEAGTALEQILGALRDFERSTKTW